MQCINLSTQSHKDLILKSYIEFGFCVILDIISSQGISISFQKNRPKAISNFHKKKKFNYIYSSQKKHTFFIFYRLWKQAASDFSRTLNYHMIKTTSLCTFSSLLRSGGLQTNEPLAPLAGVFSARKLSFC